MSHLAVVFVVIVVIVIFHCETLICDLSITLISGLVDVKCPACGRRQVCREQRRLISPDGLYVGMELVVILVFRCTGPASEVCVKEEPMQSKTT